MKKRSLFFQLLPLAIVLAISLLTNHAVGAQSVSKARYNATSKVLSLDENAAFGYLYQLDIAALSFASKEKADLFFSAITTELVSYQVNFEKKTATIQLNLRLKPEWKVQEWNTYLATLPKP